MIEVVAKLEFITPCLGNVRKPKKNTVLMPRDSQGQVVFMQTWWRGILDYGARALARCQDGVKNIQAESVIDGPVHAFTRHFRNRGYFGTQAHEAFVTGAVVAVNFMLPASVSIEDFSEILSIGGKYLGISPYGWREDYGRFRVVEVRPRNWGKRSSVDTQAGEPDSSHTKS